MSKSIKLVGVGGQGTILATKILATALIDAGYDVKMSEIHGMSQRGGSVSSEIRYGDKVYSPVIEKGHADVLIAFEQMEGARYLDYLKKDGILIINDYKVNTMITLSGKVPYPEGIIDYLKDKVNTVVVDAHAIAEKMGRAKMMNTIMLGVTVKVCQLEDLDMKAAIAQHVKPQFLELNYKAYDIGLSDTIL